MIRIYIYKLIKKDATNDDMVYIGSTTDVNKRWREHNNNCNKLKYKVYEYIMGNGGFDEWEMIIIDEIDVSLKRCEERYKFEADYIKKYDAVNKLNTHYSSRTKKEYYDDNRDIISEKFKLYYESNREIIAEKAKEYRENNKKYIAERDKKYRKNNREKFLNKERAYYERNKELIVEKKREKKCCDICGSLVRKDEIVRHQRTQKCKSKLNI